MAVAYFCADLTSPLANSLRHPTTPGLYRVPSKKGDLYTARADIAVAIAQAQQGTGTGAHLNSVPRGAQPSIEALEAVGELIGREFAKRDLRLRDLESQTQNPARSRRDKIRLRAQAAIRRAEAALRR